LKSKLQKEIDELRENLAQKLDEIKQLKNLISELRKQIIDHACALQKAEEPDDT